MRSFNQVKAKSMKINSLNGSINCKGSASFVKNLKSAAADSFARIDQIGEGTNIALDFIGKAVVVPAVILAVSKEENFAFGDLPKANHDDKIILRCCDFGKPVQNGNKITVKGKTYEVIP